MAQFYIYSGLFLVGYSSQENPDLFMGVVFGRHELAMG